MPPRGLWQAGTGNPPSLSVIPTTIPSAPTPSVTNAAPPCREARSSAQPTEEESDVV